VAPPVFKTGGRCSAPPAGSIPVRLRHLRTRRSLAAQLAPDRYDPAKSEAYTATTLAWLGDPAAENYARHILARLESSADGPPRPRRAASARLDLSLALIASDRPDEAAGTALVASTSGRVVPSNYWRAREVICAVASRGVPEAAELAEAYRVACRDGEPPVLT
jgi:hypothetical protein